MAAAVHPSVLASNVELCKLNLVGKCPRGDSCKYSHQLGPVDPRSPSPTPDVLAGPSRSPDFRVDIPAPPSMIHGLPQKVLPYTFLPLHSFMLKCGQPMIDEQGAAAPSSSMNRVCSTTIIAHASTYQTARTRTSSSTLTMFVGSIFKGTATTHDADSRIGVLKRSGRSVKRAEQSWLPRLMWLRV